MLLVFLALTVAVINVSHWFVLGRVSDALDEETSLRLETVAAAAVGEATEELLLRPDVGEDEFVRATLAGVAQRSDLEDVFLLDPQGELLFDLASVEPSRANPYTNPHQESFVVALAGDPSASPTLDASGVVFKAAYAPVRDVDGSVGAVLGVAAGGGVLARLPALRRTLRIVSIGSAALVLLLGAIFFGMSRRLATTEAALARAETLGAMGMMAAGVAHEVRNPLAIISGAAQRLRSKYGAGAHDPLFDFIPDEVDRLNGIVEGYLRFARDEPLRLGRCDLRQVVERSVRLVREDGETQAVRFTVEAAVRGPVPIAGDPQRLTQVLLNVLLNAAQAMPSGGEVRVEIVRDGGDIEVRVSDSGSGFDARALRGAFEPFFTTKEMGSGLGLAMAKRIMEGHGGTIRIANRPEGGAIVTLRLPAGSLARPEDETIGARDKDEGPAAESRER